VLGGASVTGRAAYRVARSAAVTSRLTRRVGRIAGVVAVALAGAVLGLAVGGRTSQDVGPFRTEFSLSPAWSGGTEVAIPPLGSLILDSHKGPAHLTIRLGALDQKRIQQLVADPDGVTKASASAIEDLEVGLVRLGLTATGAALLGAMSLTALVYRRINRLAVAGGLTQAMVAATAGVAVLTFRGNAIEEPRYEGLLANAPAVVGDARRIANRYDEYRAQLQRMVRNVSRLYTTVSTLPVYEPDSDTIRVLHVSDLHLNPSAWSVINTVADQFNVDMIIDTGDIVDWGSKPETGYVGAIGDLTAPYVFIRGNHDSAAIAAAVAQQRNATVLENAATSVRGLTIAGIGDPRFSPDKNTEVDTKASRRNAELVNEVLRHTGEQLAVTATREHADVCLVHDPVAASPLAGVCPVVLAGHLHHREVQDLVAPPGAPFAHTRLMVEGSTGAAGLRGLENPDAAIPLELSVLYFTRDKILRGYDDIRVGGTGRAEVTLERHVIKDEPGPVAAPTPSPTH